MTAEERKADDLVKDQVEEIQQKYASLSAPAFVEWIRDNHIKESKRKPLPA